MSISYKMGPELIVVNGVNGPFKSVPGVVTLLLGVVTALKTARGPPSK